MDRAALDVALELGVPCGGWCPRGRRAEDGPLPERYPLRETPRCDYRERTAWNVRDADATLILTRGRPRGGTAFTLRCARELERPHRVVDLDAPEDPEALRTWLAAEGVRVLNIAGPRESEHPGVYDDAVAFLRRLLA